MQIAGFGAQQLTAAPQIFQALSLGGSPPVLPVYLFGTPNARVVPVQQTSNGTVPLNLTLQAQDTANAIARLSQSASLAGLGTPLPNALVAHPPVQGGTPNTTTFVGATVPNVQQQIGNVTPPNAPPPANQPAAVTFNVTAPPPDQTTTQAIAQQTLAPQPQSGPPPPPPPYTLSNSGDANAGDSKTQQQSNPTSPQAASTAVADQSAAPPSVTSTTSIPPAANPSLVQQVVSTVQSLLIGKIYSTPVFSFYA